MPRRAGKGTFTMMDSDQFVAASSPFDARYLAFLETISTLRPSLHRYCARMTGSVMDGEDVVQEALFEAYQKLEKVCPEPPRVLQFPKANNQIRPSEGRIASCGQASLRQNLSTKPITAKLSAGHSENATPSVPVVSEAVSAPSVRQPLRFARLRLADQLSWPSDLLAWWRFLTWFLPQCGAVPPPLVSDALPVFEAWISAFARNPEGVPMAMKQAIADWLTAIETHRYPEDVGDILTRDYQKGWGAISDDELQEVERSLRLQFFLSTNSDPELQQAYFEHLLEMAERIRDGAGFIAEYAPLIHGAAIHKAVDVCIEAFLDELPEDEERHRGLFGGGRGVRDWNELSLGEGGVDFFPSSPAREPFKTFFQTAPQEALRLIRAYAITRWMYGGS
jgi:Sigma-70 region 2